MKINELKISDYDKNSPEDAHDIKDILLNMSNAIQNHSGYTFSYKIKDDYVRYVLYDDKHESVSGMIFCDDVFQLSNKIAWNIGGVVNGNIDKFLEDGETLSNFIHSQAKVVKEYWSSFGVNENMSAGDVTGLPSGGTTPAIKIGIPMSGGNTVDFRKYLRHDKKEKNFKRINRIKKCPGVPRVRKKTIVKEMKSFKEYLTEFNFPNITKEQEKELRKQGKIMKLPKIIQLRKKKRK